MDWAQEDWEAIVREHTPLAFDAAWRLLGHAADTEDVVQEALLDAFRLHARQPVANWGALLRHLATRRAIDRLRKRRSATLLPLGTLEFSAPDSEQPESVAAARELAERLRGAIAELSDREASVFSLRDFDKAGAIFAGFPGKKVEQMYGKTKFLRIKEIGKATAANAWIRTLNGPDVKVVPVKVEVEINGRREVKDFSPRVRPVHNQPDRRFIFCVN